MFESVEPIADALLYEGYSLYPYRPSALKNRFRWSFGVLAPRCYAERTASDPWFAQTECLIDAEAGAALSIKVRFLHLQRRTTEHDDGHMDTWDEGVACDTSMTAIPLDDLRGERVFRHVVAGRREVDDAIVRERWPISFLVRAAAEPAGAFVRLRVRIENESDAAAADDRDDMVRHALVATHTLLHVERGAMVSLLDPPAGAEDLAAGCANRYTWPVLVGSAGSRQMILSSPIILYDYPQIAPESAGNLFDATEIDEILSLRVATLTDEEKREARESDPRVREMIDRAESLAPPDHAKLHGAIRSTGGISPPSRGNTEFAKGCRVRLKPQRRCDSMDMFLDGRLATVEGVYRTFEDRVYVAVALEGDEAGALQRWYGRFLYFDPDEIIALDEAS